MLAAWRLNMELQKEKSLLNNIHPMVRILLCNISFMHWLFMSPKFRMNEISYRKVQPLAFWNKHSAKQIWKCRSAYQWKWQHLCWLLNCMNVWILLYKTKWMISTIAYTHTHSHSLSLSPPALILYGAVLWILCVQTELNLIDLKNILSMRVLYYLCCPSLHNYIGWVDVCRRRENRGREPGEFMP